MNRACDFGIIHVEMAQDIVNILAFFSFWLGACVASFLNVVAWRLPRGESIVSPPSHCPKCNAPIKWWQNVPIVSWLALRGRCANCREPISPRYIVVETVGGFLFLAVFWRVLASAQTVHWPSVVTLVAMWVWVSMMLVGSVIDFDHKLLPDFVTVGGMALGIAHGAFHSIILHSPFSIFHSIAGLAFGFGLLWLVRFFGSKAFKREAMGMGDVFLMGAVGALFGPVAVLVTLILSSVFGSIVGLSAVALSKTRLGRFTEIPYGPYICLGCFVWMFWGPELVNAYMEVIRK